MARARFKLAPNPAHPGTQIILANRGDGWKPGRLGKFSDAENEATIARLKKQGITVERTPARESEAA